jgi:hypothetical protein
MEQTNLVVTPDGKTWDEVTRDTSYIGTLVLKGTTDTEQAWSGVIILDEWRGSSDTFNHYFNKDFAIGYGKMTCLRTGSYIVTVHATADALDGMIALRVNEGTIWYGNASDVNAQTDILHTNITVFLQRGDWLDVLGEWAGYAGTGTQDFRRNFIEIHKN